MPSAPLEFMSRRTLTIYSSWRDRIRFTILFGVATSVELFQSRLLKSTAAQLCGEQFDVVQVDVVLESVFKVAVAHAQSTLRIGPSLLRTLVDRQHDHVTGIQEFISSLKVCVPQSQTLLLVGR
jgi:origin recognition complex subunit 3